MRSLSFGLFFLSLFFQSADAMSYQTDIRADSDEIYAAALEALESYGIEKADATDKTIETKWITDQSERKRSFLLFKTVKKFERKYQMKVNITEGDRFTHVSVISTFLFRSADASIQTPWRALKTTYEDSSLEKQLFTKILAQAEYRRTHPRQ